MKPISMIQEIARVHGGIPVLHCLPGSPATIAGIRFGDVLLQVDGRAIEDVERDFEAPQDSADRLVVTLLREGRKLSVELDCRRRHFT